MISDWVLAVGVLLLSGFVLGRLWAYWGIPKVTGYILAGIALNPDLWPLLPAHIDTVTAPLTDVCLAFITFEVGSELRFSSLRALGIKVLGLTIGESLGAFILVTIGIAGMQWMGVSALGMEPQDGLPLALLLAALAAPTDPTATLAVQHEYHAHGPVADIILQVAAFDDLMGILLFSIGVSLAALIIDGESLSVYSILHGPVVAISGGIIVGVGAG